VAWLGKLAAKVMHVEPKVMIYAGLLHDIGKALTPLSTLQKTVGWTHKDSAIMVSHVMDGYRLARDKFNFSAEVILWHHMFQPNSYPRVFPKPLKEYSAGTKVIIPYCGRGLALCDSYDASHRVNERSGEITGESIKQKMFEHNPDQRILLEELYAADVFTTEIFAEEPEAVSV
jgi:putative nucleotidyltransferase with HDIG domain